ncbi:MAG: rod shape-determining protein MreC [Gemmatimonadota bacterium]|nr:MAG: rod shape-determining protein MreC [Gemmatimonadota bacterium]
MPVGPERFTSRRDTLAFLICLLCAVAARVAPVDYQQVIASGITNTIVAPFLALQEQIELLKEARARVTQELARTDSLVVEDLETQSIRAENARLRRLLDLSARLPVEHVAAEVLRQEGPADETMLLLSVGRDHGVGPDDPVVAPGGIVGVIATVHARTSEAMIWTHPDFRASAMTQGAENNDIFGIVAPLASEGPTTTLMELGGVPFRRRVLIGATVHTSGRGVELGGVYPIGIPIGTVIADGEERQGWSRTYHIRPAVHPASLSHVIVLTGQGRNVADAFEGRGP